jgi:hypothetical protein
VSRFVIDSNVLAVAEGLYGDTSDGCVLACVENLEALQRGEITVVDEADEIVFEYLGAVRHGGRPGVGAKFAKWIHSRRFDVRVCERVRITPVNDNPPTYAEFPDDPALRNFDPDDRKFIAVAAAHPDRPPVLEAVDRVWWTHRAALAAAGIDIQFLCIPEISAED